VLETIVGNYLREQRRGNSFMCMLLLLSVVGNHELARKCVAKPLQDYFFFLGSFFEKRMKDGVI